LPRAAGDGPPGRAIYRARNPARRRCAARWRGLAGRQNWHGGIGDNHNAGKIVETLWSYCNVLRDDGLSYLDYLFRKWDLYGR
jgi:hypothetical protein